MCTYVKNFKKIKKNLELRPFSFECILNKSVILRLRGEREKRVRT